MKLFIYILILANFILPTKAQTDSLNTPNNDTTENSSIILNQKHSPKLATWLSVAVPGTGQIYNKKYWKVPIIYGLFGTFGYFANKYEKEYLFYRQAYKDRLNGLTTQLSAGEYYQLLSNDELKSEMKRWERNRNFNYIGIFLTYIANIVDASVDANLYYYDISDDLSIRIEPIIYSNNNCPNTIGVNCKISF
jgi:hypothetical protein